MIYRRLVEDTLEAGPKTTRELIDAVMDEHDVEFAEAEKRVRYVLLRLQRLAVVERYDPPMGTQKMWALAPTKTSKD